MSFHISKFCVCCVSICCSRATAALAPQVWQAGMQTPTRVAYEAASQPSAKRRP
jgi:hypothetical protein